VNVPDPKSREGGAPESARLERQRWLKQRASGWTSERAPLVDGLLLFLALSGLSIRFLPFSAFNQHAVLTHTLLGLAWTPLAALYLVRHLRAYWSFPLTQIKFTGWIAAGMTLICAASGWVLTGQGLVGTRITYVWRTIHLLSTFGLLLFLVPHLLALIARARDRSREPASAEVLDHARVHGRTATLAVGLGLLATLVLTLLVRPPAWRNEFPSDYALSPYEGAGPFSPSLAMTSTGGAFDPRSLGGSASCGTAGCHEAIYAEWLPSAHHYSAMDPAFQRIQSVMSTQNGPISTRYCAGCHDPISLFQGSKDFVLEGVQGGVSGRVGYDEGVSCLACHAIEQTDIKGNANYVIHQPQRYVWELLQGPWAKRISDFLIRTYPDQHIASLSRRMFKTPEFCAACHKQFIDEEVNQVGWVQLQNQYDNWKASRWNHPDQPELTIECRECHMPLTAARDPAAGDTIDRNRSAADGLHRSHRFLGGNQFIPTLLDLPGGSEHVALTERWLRGEIEVPEIASRWRSGPAVPIELELPSQVRPGEQVELRVRMINNKVGHDFPTGPLDIIQAWLEVEVTDPQGQVVFQTGRKDERNIIEPGTYMFKAEPVDRYGNLIDRHNLWEMVGVRFKRSLFPGASEVARFDFPCPGTGGDAVRDLPRDELLTLTVPPEAQGELRVHARLNYRKIDQYLMNFAFGEDAGLSAAVTTVSEASGIIRVAAAGDGGGQGGD
jgi:hypothetical protein